MWNTSILTKILKIGFLKQKMYKNFICFCFALKWQIFNIFENEKPWVIYVSMSFQSTRKNQTTSEMARLILLKGGRKK